MSDLYKEVYSFVIEVIIISWLCSRVNVYVQLYVAIKHYIKIRCRDQDLDQNLVLLWFEILHRIAEGLIVFGRMKDAYVLYFDARMSG